MPAAILDPFSGISGDMTLGALIDVGLDDDWLRSLPGKLGIGDVGVRIERVRRSDITCVKVDFDIPPQPHGRGLHEIREILRRADMPELVRTRADAAFAAIAVAEGEIHGVPPERVHLHEVGAVDAILDVVGVVWGFEMLGVERVFCGPIALGDGTVKAAHGTLPVPAPATLKLLEGLAVRPGPEGSGELVTPTGAALVRTLSSGPPPAQYVPLRSGYGAGTRELPKRANALRLILAEPSQDHAGIEELVELVSDIDDMDGEQTAAAAEMLRAAGALDVVLLHTLMKKGRPGTRIAVLTRPGAASGLEDVLLTHSSSIGVRRITVHRRALPREMRTVSVFGQDVRVKIVTLPNGQRSAKAEFEDLVTAARVTGKSLRDLAVLAREAAERALPPSV